MASTSPKRQTKLPAELAGAIESGELSREQAMELLALRAARLGLTSGEALERARRNDLPYSPLGLEIRGLAFLLGERQPLLYALPAAKSTPNTGTPVQLPEGEDDGRPHLPDELIEAIEGGVLTDEQLRQLIAFEAAQLGLSYDEAVVLGRYHDWLPRTPIGMDLEGWIAMLPSEAIQTSVARLQATVRADLLATVGEDAQEAGDEVLAAVGTKQLNRDQLQRLIELEASQLGLTATEAVVRARRDELPHTLLAADLRALVSELGT